jgi:hypothetical protein
VVRIGFKLHEASLNVLRDRYSKILSTEEAIEEIEANVRKVAETLWLTGHSGG